MVYRDQEKLMVTALRLLDLAVVEVSFVLAIEIRSLLDFPLLEPFTRSYSLYWDKFLLVLFLWWVLLSWNKMYVSHRGRSLRQISWLIIKVNMFGLLFLGTILFFRQEFLVHRTLILFFVAICTALLILEKSALFSMLHQMRKRGRFIKYALILGTGEDARWLLSQLRLQGSVGIKVIGFVRDGRSQELDSIDGLPVFGSAGDMRSLLEKHVVDEVFITTSFRDLSQIEPVLLVCQDIGINARVLVRSLAPNKAKIFVDEFMETPFISFSTTSMSVFALHTKMVIDFLTAVVLLAVLAPLLVVIGLLIKLDSPGPALFKQKRVGRNGRVFNIYKFRSMVKNAEERRGEVEHLNTSRGPVFKARSDPRITRMGRVLRRTSLDELPQLFNVLVGEMSLVGPRPHPVYESEKINGSARRRLSMKPGMTGLWQVSGRSELDFAERIRLDLEYIDGWSLLLDIRLLLQTLSVFFARKGAY